MTVELLTEQHLEFLSLDGYDIGWSESIHVKMLQCYGSFILSPFVRGGFLHKIINSI